MRVLLRAGVQEFSDWGIDLLVKQVNSWFVLNFKTKQLNDNDPKVAQLALNVLDEASDEVESLDSLISKKPDLLKLGEAGKNLWLR